MKNEDQKILHLKILNIKKDLFMLRLKSSSGESALVKSYKSKKKEIARLFTEINKKNKK